MLSRYLIRACFYLCLLALHCAGETYRWVERPIGRPDFQGSGFAEMPDGRLLVLDHNGIYAFDGSRFTKMGAGAETGTVHGVVSGTAGEMWVGAEEGLFRLFGGRYEQVLQGRIIDLLRLGPLWIATLATPRDGPRLVQLFPGKPKWTYQTLLPEQMESRLQVSPDRAVYFSLPRRICKLSLLDGKPLIHCDEVAFAGSSGLPIEDILRSSSGTLYGRSNLSVIRWSLDRSPRSRLLLGGGSPSNLVERLPGEICGIFGKSLHCWSETGEWTYPIPIAHRTNAARCYSRGDGTVWMSFIDYGLLGLSIHREISEISYSNGLDGFVFDTLPLPDGTLLSAGTPGVRSRRNGTSRWLPWGGEMANTRTARIRRSGEHIGLAMPGLGLRVFDLTGVFRGGVEDFGSAEGRLASTLQPDAQDEWLVGGRGGLFSANVKTGKGARVPLPREGAVKDIDRLADGSFAVAYTGGLAIGKRGAWRQIDETHGLRSAAVQSVYGELLPGKGRGEFWVGYDLPTGFARVQADERNVKVTNFGAAEGFEDLAVFDLLRGAQGTLWRGGGRGIYLSDGKNFGPGDWYTWSAKSGLTNPDESMNSMRLDADGSVWMGSMGGILRIQPPADLMSRNYSVRTFLSHVQVDGREVSELAPLRMERAGSRLEVELSQLNLEAEPQLSYEYRLRPASDKWERAGESKILIERLPGGSQTLEVRARQTRFITPANVASLMIESPLSWGHVAARTGAILGGIVTLGFGWHWRWGFLAWLPLLRLRRQAEKALFLRLRSQDVRGRQPLLWTLPGTMRKRIAGMLARHDAQLAGESATPSGPPALLDGRYVLEHPVAQGGSATVYFARDLESKLPVAVKLFHRKPAVGTWHARKLKEEGHSLSKIEHRGIVRLLDAGESRVGLPYLVMEYIAGTTLRQELRAGPMAEERVIARLEEMLGALVAVHAAGILHRDLKPENIMLRNAHSSEEDAVLIDFGVAYLHDALRQAGDSTYDAWTPGYVAPEQTVGMRTAACDVYSMGLIAFEMLSGLRFRQEVEAAGGEIAIQMALEKAGVSNALEWSRILASTTQLEYSKRVQTAAEFLELVNELNSRRN